MMTDGAFNQSFQGKNWCWTLHDYTSQDMQSIGSVNSDQFPAFKYICYGCEVCPTTAKKHLQGFVQFSKKLRFSQAKEFFTRLVGRDTTHIEGMRGTVTQAIDYCKGDCKGKSHNEVFIEIGDSPSIAGKSSDLESALANTTNMLQLHDDYPSVFLHHYKGFQAFYAISQMKEQCKLPAIKVHWYHGGTGSGKTFAALQKAREICNLPADGTRDYENIWISMPGTVWMEGYFGQRVMIFDDLRRKSGTTDTFNLLLRLCDPGIRTKRLECKGSSVMIMATDVFITCPRKPDEEYQFWSKLHGEYEVFEDISQLNRRLTECVLYRKETINGETIYSTANGW